MLLMFSQCRGGTPVAAPDTTAPVLTSAVGTKTGSSTATIGVTTDEGNGTLYGVVTQSATQPSIAQIKAGQNHSGAAADYASSQSISSTGAKTFSATGLTAATTFYAHHVHTDAAGNNSNRLSSSSFTTDAASSGARAYTNTPVAGYGGLVMLETHLKWAEPGDTVSIWVGRWGGNSGELTITWDCQDGSRTVANAVDGYAGLSKTLVIPDGDHGWFEIQIPLQTWTQTDREHIVFRITDVTIDNAAEFDRDMHSVVYLRIDDGAIVNSSRLWCDKDHPSASDSNAGTESLPFLTLQKLINEMVSQNKSGYVVAAATPYQELSKYPSSPFWAGPTFNRTSGGANYNDFLYLDGLKTDSARVSAFKTESPIIDQNFTTVGGTNDAACMYIWDGDSIWISDFEMCHARHGFNTSDVLNKRIIAERLHEHHIIGDATGPGLSENLGGKRWQNTVESLIHNCCVHDNYDDRVSAGWGNPYGNANITAGSYNGQSLVSYHNGMQFWGCDRVTVEYCEGYEVSRPIYTKEQRDADGSLVQAVWAQFNYFHQVASYCYDSHNQGTGNPGAKDALFAFNKTHQAFGFLDAKDGGATGGQPDGVFIFNNSGSNLDGLVQIKGATGVRYADNAMSSPNSTVGNATPQVVNLLPAENGSYDTFLDSARGTLLHNFSSLEFNVDKDGANEHQETSIAGWQSVYTDHATPAASYMSGNPDAGLSTSNPNFTSASTGNFTRTGTPTDSFLGGSQLGCMVDAQTVVGNY